MMKTKQSRMFIKDYDDHALKTTAFDITDTYRNREVDGALIGREFATDAYIMHSEEWKNLMFNPKSTSVWKETLQQYYETDEYRKLNDNVAGDGMLSKLATLGYIDRVVGVAQQYSQTNQNFQQTPPQQGQQGQNGQPQIDLNQFFSQLDQVQNNPNQKNLAASVQRSLARAGQEAAEESAQLASAALGFSHYGLPILKFGDPDEMRNILSNKVVVALLRVLKKLGSSDEGRSGAQPSARRGIPIGAKRMRSFSEIPDILPVEHLNPALFSYRLINRKVQVRQRFASMSDYLVYLDVSGSMTASAFTIDGMRIPNISYAAGCVIAMTMHLAKNGARLTLKPFGSSVYEEINDRMEIIKTCLKLQANDGTDLQKVLEDSFQYRDRKIVIVSDGIDHIQDEEVLKRAARNDVSAILLNTEAPQLEKYIKVNKVDSFSGNFLMKV